MDGTHLRPLVKEAVYKASGVALDLVNKRLYWSDILLDYIETVEHFKSIWFFSDFQIEC